MVLPASCPHSVVVTMGNCRHKDTVLDIPLGWCVVTNDEKKYAHQPFDTTPKPGKCAVSTGSYMCTRDPAARKSKSQRFPGSMGRSYEWLRMTCVLDEAERNQIMWPPLIYLMNSLLITFLILLSVVLVICVLELSSKQHRPRREKTCLLAFQQSEF